ncbi:MAG: aminopeptidase P family protein [Anaerolineales bacterium]|nr:aminopeptidase P family protein [Anaerolineales bacterium]
MQKRGLDALLVVGPAQHNPAMVYLTGGAHLTEAYLVKKRGQPAVLFHRTMERDEAARTGLETRNLEIYHMSELLKQAGGDMLGAYVALFKNILADLGIVSGRVAIYGHYDLGQAYALFSALQAALPAVSLVGEFESSLLSAAMTTKDAAEVERIRRVGQFTTQVIGQVADFLASRRVRGDTLIQPGDEPLTIGDVKRQINLWLAERGLENPEGTIFAIGYDAGVPHSTGTNTDPLRLGQTIIFDIFPCEAGGGYYYDMTRTWCLGYAPDEAQALYDDVFSVYRQVISELRQGAPFKLYQARACELFEARGHPTIKDDPTLEQGYVHSLGHGLGLCVHERPSSRLTGSDEERLEPGVIFTIEPGLYYPGRRLGVRLEDTLWARPDGAFEILAEHPLDLVLPVRRR